MVLNFLETSDDLYFYMTFTVDLSVCVACLIQAVVRENAAFIQKKRSVFQCDYFPKFSCCQCSL